jgi:hypothetical protein
MLPASVGFVALDRAAPQPASLRRLGDVRSVVALLRHPTPVTRAPVVVDDDETADPDDEAPDPADAIELGDEDPVYVGADGQLVTAERIRAYLEQYTSPLAPYATEIVRAGRRWDMDPRLIVAIAGTESTFGRYHHGHNAWGWDAPNGLTRWPSWRSGIARYVRLFATAYRSRDPKIIGPRYSPLDPTWAETTAFFFAQM